MLICRFFDDYQRERIALCHMDNLFYQGMQKMKLHTILMIGFALSGLAMESAHACAAFSASNACRAVTGSPLSVGRNNSSASKKVTFVDAKLRNCTGSQQRVCVGTPAVCEEVGDGAVVIGKVTKNVLGSVTAQGGRMSAEKEFKVSSPSCLLLTKEGGQLKMRLSSSNYSNCVCSSS